MTARISTGLILFLLLAVVSGVPLAVRPVNGIIGGGVLDKQNVWAPYGPDASINHLVMKFYGDDTSELYAFETGQIDVMDNLQTNNGVPPPLYYPFDGNPDFVITPAQGGPLYHGIYYNLDDTSDGTGTVWHSWGCPFQHGNSACGIEIRQAFAHLLDRPRFVSDGPLQGGALALADDVAANKVDPVNGRLVASSLVDQCSWDTLYLANSINSGYQSKYGNCLGAFNIAPDLGGFARPGSPDFCAAVDHLIRAAQLAPSLGLQRDPAAPLDIFGNQCGIDPASPGLVNITAHPMRAKPRSTNPRLTMGMNFANAINQLFAGNVVNTIQIGSGGVLGHTVFFCCLPGSFATDDWEWYTFGYQDTNPYPTSLFTQFDSQFASSPCGAALVIQPTDPTFVCIPALDSLLQVVATTPDQASLYNNTYGALNILGSHAVDLPAYTFGLRDAALRSVTGLVNAMGGVGYSNPWTILYAHKGIYAPVNPLYQFDGGGVADTVRWGQAGGGIVANLGYLFAGWTWEFNILNEVYDTLFAQNPTAPTQVFCWVCNSFDTSRRDVFGNEIIDVQLKQNLRWQDGVPLDAYDVAFSIVTERDYTAVLSGNVSPIQNVVVNGPLSLSVTWTGASIDVPFMLGSTLIVPQHIYGSGDNLYAPGVSRPSASVLDPSYDPIARGTFIGSGPFVCRSVFPEDLGRIGTGCVVNADGSRGGQAIGPGGTVILSKYDRTSESGNVDPFNQWFRSNNPAWGTSPGEAAFSGQFQEFSWADRYNNATVTIQDLASVAACFGKSTPSGCPDYSYWLRPAFHTGTPNTITSELTIVASHLDDTWVYPFSWTGNQSSQPGPPIWNIVNGVPFPHPCRPGCGLP